MAGETEVLHHGAPAGMHIRLAGGWRAAAAAPHRAALRRLQSHLLVASGSHGLLKGSA